MADLPETYPDDPIVADDCAEAFKNMPPGPAGSLKTAQTCFEMLIDHMPKQLEKAKQGYLEAGIPEDRINSFDSVAKDLNEFATQLFYDTADIKHKAHWLQHGTKQLKALKAYAAKPDAKADNVERLIKSALDRFQKGVFDDEFLKKLDSLKKQAESLHSRAKQELEELNKLAMEEDKKRGRAVAVATCGGMGWRVLGCLGCAVVGIGIIAATVATGGAALAGLATYVGTHAAAVAIGAAAGAAAGAAIGTGIVIGAKAYEDHCEAKAKVYREMSATHAAAVQMADTFTELTKLLKTTEDKIGPLGVAIRMFKPNADQHREDLEMWQEFDLSFIQEQLAEMDDSAIAAFEQNLGEVVKKAEELNKKCEAIQGKLVKP